MNLQIQAHFSRLCRCRERGFDRCDSVAPGRLADASLSLSARAPHTATLRRAEHAARLDRFRDGVDRFPLVVVSAVDSTLASFAPGTARDVGIQSHDICR